MNATRGGILLVCFLLAPVCIQSQDGKFSIPKYQDPRNGFIKVYNSDAASLLVDGKLVNSFTGAGFLTTSALPGEHTVVVRDKKTGCKWEKKLTVETGKQVFVSALTNDCSDAPPPDIPISSSLVLANGTAEDDHNRGCRLMMMRREGEAVLLLKRSAKLLPALDSDCLDQARSVLREIQGYIQKCKPPQDCSYTNAYFFPDFGYYKESFDYIDTLIGRLERSGFPRNVASHAYETRAISLYALGNSDAALRDMQTALDWEKREPEVTVSTLGNPEAEIHFHRAAILADMGNEAAASEDCRFVLASTSLPKAPNNLLQRAFCGHITSLFPTPGSAGKGDAQGPSSIPGSPPSIDQEIQSIKNGNHISLPQIQSSGLPSSNGIGAFKVTNKTTYTLTVLFSGPIERRVEVVPSGAVSIDLPTGRYRIAGRVNAPNVTPAYDEYLFDSSTAGIGFFIQ